MRKRVRAFTVEILDNHVAITCVFLTWLPSPLPATDRRTNARIAEPTDSFAVRRAFYKPVAIAGTFALELAGVTAPAAFADSPVVPVAIATVALMLAVLERESACSVVEERR